MRIKLFLLCLISSFSLQAQDNVKELIRGTFTEYLDQLVKGNYAESLDYVTDDFFNIVPKDQMIQVMESTFNSPMFGFEFKDMKILEIQDPEKIEKEHYALLTYSSHLIMSFKDKEPISAEEKAKRSQMMKISFDASFGEENVKYDDEIDAFDIYTKKDVFAISKDEQFSWKFVVLEKEQRMILEQVLPKVLIDRIYEN